MRTKTSLLEPVKKLSCLNDSGTAKLVKVCTAIQTETSLRNRLKNKAVFTKSVKKRSCLYEIG